MKKKIIYLLLITLVLCAVFSGCAAKKNSGENSEKKLKIVTTVFPQYDFAKNICGELAEVSMLLPVGSDAHSFEPAPADIIKLLNADLFIYVGGESESWVSDVIKSAELSEDKTLALKNIINFSEERISSENISGEIIGGENEQDHEHETEYDEHVWTSVRNAVKICSAIYEKVSAADKVNEAEYKKNFENYAESLAELDKEFSEITEKAKRNTVIFADRFPFLYLMKDYNLNYYAAFPGCASETEPSAATIANLSNKIKEESIPSVFYIEFSNEKVADILCESTGAKKLLLHSCHNVTKKQFEDDVSYVELMKNNAVNLREALN